MPITFNRTRTQIAQMVLSKLGRVGLGVTPATADTDIVYEAIDMRLKEMRRLGIYWRKVGSIPLTFSVTSGVNSASATADIDEPIKLTFTNGSADDPVDLISPIQYAQIGNKTESGNPTVAVWDRSAHFTLHPVPLSDGTMKLLYAKIPEDSSAGGVADLDVSTLRWIRDIICYDCGDYYGKPDPTMLRYKQEAEIAERNIRKLVVPRVDFEPVAVDNWTSNTNTETDY